MEQVSHFFLNLIDQFGYPGLFVVMALGNVGIPVGTELVMPIAGALVATGHLSSLWITGGVATLGEVTGGLILYTVGYYGGRPFVARWGKYLKLNEQKLDRFHGFYERHGNVVVFVCRFLPIIRGIAALPAGVSRMQKRWFILYTALGSAIFCFGLALIGSAFGQHIDQITLAMHHFSRAVILIGILAVVGLVALQLFRRRAQS